MHGIHRLCQDLWDRQIPEESDCRNTEGWHHCSCENRRMQLELHVHLLCGTEYNFYHRKKSARTLCTFCQVLIIRKLICIVLDLAGKTDLDQAQADMIADCFEDALKPISTFRQEQDPAKKVNHDIKYN